MEVIYKNGLISNITTVTRDYFSFDNKTNVYLLDVIESSVNFI